MAGKSEQTDVPSLFTGDPEDVRDVNILEYAEQSPGASYGFATVTAEEANDTGVFDNEQREYDNVIVFLSRGETAELSSQPCSDDTPFDDVKPVQLERGNDEWMILAVHPTLGYALATKSIDAQPLLPAPQDVIPDDAEIWVNLVANPDLPKVVRIRYNTEDRSDIAFNIRRTKMTAREFKSGVAGDFAGQLRHIERSYPRVMLELTAGSDANDALASAKKRRGGKKQAKRGKGEERVARTNAGDAEGAVLWRGPRSPAEMKSFLDTPGVVDHDMLFAAMLGEREYANLVEAISDRRRFRARAQKGNKFRRAKTSALHEKVSRTAGRERSDDNVVWRREGRYGTLRIERGEARNLEPVSSMVPDRTETISVIDHVFTDPNQFLDWEAHPQHQLIVVPFEGYQILVQELNPDGMTMHQNVVSKGYPHVVEAGIIHSVRFLDITGQQTQENTPRYFSAVYFTLENEE